MTFSNKIRKISPICHLLNFFFFFFFFFFLIWVYDSCEAPAGKEDPAELVSFLFLV